MLERRHLRNLLKVLDYCYNGLLSIIVIIFIVYYIKVVTRNLEHTYVNKIKYQR